MKKKNKKPKYCTVKVYYIDEIDFMTGETLPPVQERYDFCKVVHQDRNGLLYIERQGEIYVYDPNSPNINIIYEE